MSLFESALFECVEMQLPLRVTAAKRGIGSFLTIELSETEKTNEQWSIWIYLCDWAFLKDENDLLNSDSEDGSAYEGTLENILGLRLEGVVAGKGNESCEFTFSNGLLLFVDDASDIYGPRKDLFMLFHGRKCVGAFRSGIGLVPSNW